MSRAGTTAAAKSIQAKMQREREAKIAVERKRLEAEDKIKFAEEDKRIAEERRRVKDAVATRRRIEEEHQRQEQGAHEARQREAERDATTTTPARVTRTARVRSDAHATYKVGRKIADDEEFIATVAAYVRKDAAATWQDVLAAMRKDGIAGGTGRMARLFPRAQEAAKSGKKTRR